MKQNQRSWMRTPPAWMLILLLALLGLPAIAGEETAADDEDEAVVVAGAQGVTVDADDERDAKFDKNGDQPDGIVLDRFRWSHAGDKNWMQISARDMTQRDEQFALRAGFGDRVKLRLGYGSLPYRYGSGATSLLTRGAGNMYGPTYRIGDVIQQTLEDPDANGVPFFTDAMETAADNMLVQGFTRDLLTNANRFDLESRRRTGNFGLTFNPAEHWTIDLDVNHEKRDGLQALGSGTYQRITDVNGDGTTDYDYFFSVRGVELPAIIDYSTTRVELAANYAAERWFVDVRGTVSEFENQHLGITYDNPFWFNGIEGTSGSRRGLWEEGRVSLEPSNEAMNFSVSAGVNLAKNTRLLASVSIGENTQDDRLMPITTNPATIATADINRDGNIDLLDDPTLAPAGISGLPTMIDGSPVVGSSLNASSDTTAYNLTVTSRPVQGLTLTGRLRSYEYEGTEGILAVPARTEYIESRVKLDFKGDTILHVPLHFTRDTIDLDATYRFNRNFKLKAFLKQKSYDYDQYQDTDANATRDLGGRAVSGTDDDIYGLTAMFGGGGWFSGRATFQTAERTFDGSYSPGFSGENSGVRQFDIANRERDAFDVHFDFMPAEMVTIGLGYRMTEDDFPDSVYGYTAAESSGLDVNVNYTTPSGVNLFAYVDQSDWDVDMHLRTKCSNCSLPPGSSPWDVPNFDWFSEYDDSSLAVGVGLNFAAGKDTKIDFSINQVDATIEQTTANPATPTELNPANPLLGTVANVALGFDFPDQENTFLTTEFKLTRRLNDNVSVGLWWLYEDFELEDFQWDDLQPYGADFLTVDDATRFLFLDSRYSDYTAHVAQVFMKFHY